MTARGLLVAAPRSGSGKTTITLGLQRALTRRGLKVRGLKCGPDYIDPAFHAAATGAPSANLDSYAMTDALLVQIANEAAAGAADIIVAEGSMGLFDGVPGPDGHTGTGADIAALLGWPVVLVIDVSGQAQSAGAVALGCMLYDKRIRVAGVILNKVASERHRRLAAAGMEKIGLPVLGALPREASLILPERHLGLVQAGETEDLHQRLDALAEAVTAAVDLGAVLAAAGATALPASTRQAVPLPAPGKCLAIARDAAFSFVYPHVEAGWRALGTELVPFSPLADEPPPESCDACWLPGGYPELHAGRLAGASRFLDGLRDFARTRPVHGECGGYMVLGRSLIDADGTSHAMAGLLSVETSFARRKMNLGYRNAALAADGPLGLAGARLSGHEFHYATVISQGEDPAFAEVTDPHGSAPAPAGSRRGLVSGSFFHAIAVREGT